MMSLVFSSEAEVGRQRSGTTNSSLCVFVCVCVCVCVCVHVCVHVCVLVCV